jgi:hypothetical protein
MTLTGVLRQDVVLRPVAWTGTEPDYGMATEQPARVESSYSVITDVSGSVVPITALAYLDGAARVEVGDLVTVDTDSYYAVRVDTQRAGAGAHHLVVSLTPEPTSIATITRDADPGDWDPATGVVNQPPPTLVWSGPANVLASSGSTDRPSADQVVHATSMVIQIPVQTPSVEVGDRVTVETDDPLLSDTLLAVVGVGVGDVFWRRLSVARVT